MHILFLNSWYPNRILKQNGDFIQRHAEAVALQHKVTALHVKSDPNLNQKIEITQEVKNGVKTYIAYVKATKNPILKILRFSNGYRKLLDKIDKIDVVHVNKLFPVGIIALWLKKTKRIPFIITEHHTIYHKPYATKIGIIERFLSKQITKNASFIAPVSNDLAKAMQKFGLTGNYTKVPNVVDTNRFKAKEKNNAIFTILHVSSMNKVKNINGILRTIKALEKHIPSFQFQMIGGNAEDFLDKAKQLQLNEKQLVFKNQVSHKEIVNYFQKADVFLLFSDVENLPCVILEAFSCGTPVITTNVGGIAEYFPEEFGLLIPPKDEKALLNAMLKIHADFNPVTPEKMHQYVEQHFSKEQICNAFTKLYRKAIQQNYA